MAATSVEEIINALLSRVSKLEGKVQDLEADMIRLKRRTIGVVTYGSEANFGGGESREYKKR